MQRWRNWGPNSSVPPRRWTYGLIVWGSVVKKTLHASERSRPDVVEQRKVWQEKLADLPAAKLVFVDESGANTQMTRRYGRSPVGERLVCTAPQGHYQTTTLIAAVRLKGAIRAVDSIARLGGDEFVIVFAGPMTRWTGRCSWLG